MNREATRSEAEARVGRTLSDKWKLEKLLGMGGMAAVYLATHRNRSRAAVKMLHRSLSSHEPVRRRFLREGYVANTVEHPGAVRVIDDDVDAFGDAYLVLELLEGESLDDRWERQGRRLSPREATELGIQLLDVLEAAHQRGIVHRDVKPDNVFLTKSGQLKLLDFGIARLDEGEGSATSTGTGAAMGTPAFMSPEQARGRWDLVDGRTDVWAVGATLFTLLTGRPVHQEGTVNETLIAAATQRAPTLVSVAPHVPAVLAAVVDRALAYDREERWPSAASMQEGLRRALAQLGEGDAQITLAESRQQAASADTISIDAQAGGGTLQSSPHAAPAPRPLLISPVAQAATSGTLMSSSSERGSVPPNTRRFLALGIGAAAIGTAVWSIALRNQPRAEAPLASAPVAESAAAAPQIPSAPRSPAVSAVAAEPTPALTLAASAIAPLVATSAPPATRAAPRSTPKPAAKPSPSPAGDDPFDRQY